MTRNINTLDKQVRIAISVVMVIVAILLSSNTLGLIIPLAVAVILTATVFLNFCPIYKMLGISTCPDGMC